jgi:hypothetical protein
MSEVATVISDLLPHCFRHLILEDDSLLDMAHCTLIEADQRWRGMYCLCHQRNRPDDEGSMHL